jgi:hypothetical protein
LKGAEVISSHETLVTTTTSKQLESFVDYAGPSCGLEKTPPVSSCSSMDNDGSSSSSSKFKVGDTVSILRHGKAIIISDIVTDAQHERFGRYQVSAHKDSTAVNTCSLLRQQTSTLKISKLQQCLACNFMPGEVSF